jgi:GxxExxY protein
MAQLLTEKGLHLVSQQRVPLYFRGLYLDCELRFDLLVENLIILEIKAVENILPVHEAQLLTYMKLMERPKGILINFNCTNIFKEGQKTLVNELFPQLPRGY